MNNRLGDIIGNASEENFADFDLTEIHQVLSQLQDVNPIDISHAELLQQQALRGADIITEYLGKLVKTVGYLETRANTTRNQVALNYQASEGRTTMEMRKFAAEASPDVEEILIKLAKAKASKMVLEKKFDILIRSHHFYKDIAAGLRKTILGHSNQEKISEGWQ